MTAEDISKLTLGPIGDRVMYENELVRVWDFVVEPGKSKGWHRHELPYVIIPMTDGDIELESALTGEIERPKGKIGEPIWRDAGEVHDLRNVGKCDVSKHFGRDQTAITFVPPERSNKWHVGVSLAKRREDFVDQVRPLIAAGAEIIIHAGRLPMLLFARMSLPDRPGARAQRHHRRGEGR